MNPADTLLPLAEASKEASLDFWGTWLVIATLVVIAGLVIEYVPDFYERLEHSKWKRWFVIPGAVGVVLGVVGEGITEFKALRTEGALRSIVHEEDDVQALAIASVNARAKEAERETALTKLQEAKVERLLSGKLELDAVGLDKLRTYSGTPVFVETTPPVWRSCCFADGMTQPDGLTPNILQPHLSDSKYTPVGNTIAYPTIRIIGLPTRD
jgi:hypothetical protein